LNKYFWIAVNGPSVAMFDVPLSPENICAVPTPEFLFGFKAAAEAKAAQQTLLTAPASQVQSLMRSWLPRIAAGEMALVQPENPEPPTTGATVWCERADNCSE
jgi:hypothetical protein